KDKLGYFGKNNDELDDEMIEKVMDMAFIFLVELGYGHLGFDRVEKKILQSTKIIAELSEEDIQNLMYLWNCDRKVKNLDDLLKEKDSRLDYARISTARVSREGDDAILWKMRVNLFALLRGFEEGKTHDYGYDTRDLKYELKPCNEWLEMIETTGLEEDENSIPSTEPKTWLTLFYDTLDMSFGPAFTEFTTEQSFKDATRR
ncbi:hypothetical protein ACJX0J_039686, partial [Zea mays]